MEPVGDAPFVLDADHKCLPGFRVGEEPPPATVNEDGQLVGKLYCIICNRPMPTILDGETPIHRLG